MALKRWTYLCSKCGHPRKMNLPVGERPRSRYQFKCQGACKRKRRWFYPARRPITGHWRRA